jgi:hypothetical protein
MGFTMSNVAGKAQKKTLRFLVGKTNRNGALSIDTFDYAEGSYDYSCVHGFNYGRRLKHIETKTRIKMIYTWQLLVITSP